MAKICSICGLPKDLCVCQEINREQQKIRLRLETRKWGREVTMIEGISESSSELTKLAAQLKAQCACGGTVKNNTIMLQGDHREKAKLTLVKLGFPLTNIEVS